MMPNQRGGHLRSFAPNASATGLELVPNIAHHALVRGDLWHALVDHDPNQRLNNGHAGSSDTEK